MSVLAELIELILGNASDQQRVDECADYLILISDDLLSELASEFPKVSPIVIAAIWCRGITLLVEELQKDE
jgi:hypothetical protein